jgi:hypothetical protein
MTSLKKTKPNGLKSNTNKTCSPKTRETSFRNFPMDSSAKFIQKLTKPNISLPHLSSSITSLHNRSLKKGKRVRRYLIWLKVIRKINSKTIHHQGSSNKSRKAIKNSPILTSMSKIRSKSMNIKTLKTENRTMDGFHPTRLPWSPRLRLKSKLKQWNWTRSQCQRVSSSQKSQRRRSTTGANCKEFWKMKMMREKKRRRRFRWWSSTRKISNLSKIDHNSKDQWYRIYQIIFYFPNKWTFIR